MDSGVDKDVLLALGRLEGKVDALISQTKVFQADITDHDARIRSLESSKAVIYGVCGVLAALVSSAVTIISTFL